MVRERRPSPKRIAITPHEETAAERWLRTLRLSGFSVILLGLLILAVVVLAPALRTLVDQQQQIAALERDVAAQQQQVAHLQVELDRWTDPAYIEAQARERLLFVYPGEVSFLVIDQGTGEETATEVVSSEIQATEIDWLSGLLAATFQAGLTQLSGEDLAPVEWGAG